MNDYNELLERCKEICDWQDTGLLKGDALRNFAASRPYDQQHNAVSIAQAETLREVADAFIASVDRIDELESSLAATSDMVNKAFADGKAEGHGDATEEASVVIGELRARVAELDAERAERERQKPMAWEGAEQWEPLAMFLCADENGSDSCHEMVWEGYPPEPWGERWQKYESEARRMIDLTRYAFQTVTAPVRLTDSEAEAVARIHGTGGWQTLADMMRFSRAIEAAVLRSNGFKVEE